MNILSFILLNLLILSLNIFWLLFLLLGFVTHDDISYSANPEKTLLIRNCVFFTFYILVYSIKFSFLPLLSLIFKKNRYLKYLFLKLKRNKNFWKKLLFHALLFDVLTIFVVILFAPNTSILICIIAPLVLLPLSYYIGGGVFLSYLGLYLYIKLKQQKKKSI